MQRITKHLRNPGVVLGVIAIVIAVAGTSVVAVGKKKKVKNPIQQVTQGVVVPAQATNNGVFAFQLDCPANTKVIGGGLTVAQPPAGLDPLLVEDGPQGNGWRVAGDNDLTSHTGTLTVICFKTK